MELSVLSVSDCRSRYLNMYGTYSHYVVYECVFYNALNFAYNYGRTLSWERERKEKRRWNRGYLSSVR